MVTKHPLTPPPSSSLELQDQARSDNMQCDSAVLAPATNFEQTFRSIVECSSQNRFRELIQIAEQADLNSYGDPDNPARLCVLVPLVFAYLIIDDLPPAKHVLLRLPDSPHSTSLSTTIRNLSSACWQRAYVQVYANTKSLNDLLVQADFFDKGLANALTHMLASFIESFRRRTTRLLMEAYTTVPLSLATEYLGMSKQDVLSALERDGWQYDQTSDTLAASSRPEAKTTSITGSLTSPLSTFYHVAESVSQLESY